MKGKANQINYRKRLNKVIEYVQGHLDEEIKMEKLAQISHFSPFHFQRIYKAIIQETPYETLFRLRLEKSIFLLKHYPHLKISEVAFQCGFPSIENFSRQFKRRFSTTASQFKKNKKLQNSRIYQEKNLEDFYHYIKEGRNTDSETFKVKIDKLPNISIAYIPAVFGADGSLLIKKYQELMHWVEQNDIPYQGELRRFGMSIDNPSVTPAGKFRYDFAIKIEQSYPPEGLIEFGKIPSGQFATVHVKGKLHQVAQAWDHLYRYWLPNSGYIPKHQNALEEFIQGPEEIGWENFNIKCRIPIKPLKN